MTEQTYLNIQDSLGNVTSSLKEVVPEIWRGSRYFDTDNDNAFDIFLVDNYDLAKEEGLDESTLVNYFTPLNIFNVFYNGSWRKSLAVIEYPTLNTTAEFPGESMNHDNHEYTDTDNSGNNGLFFSMKNFSNSQRSADKQQISYTSGNSKFSLDRDNTVGGTGTIVWRWKTTAYSGMSTTSHLNPGKVLIFDF